jgi:hypothetical protein
MNESKTGEHVTRSAQKARDRIVWHMCRARVFQLHVQTPLAAP